VDTIHNISLQDANAHLQHIELIGFDARAGCSTAVQVRLAANQGEAGIFPGCVTNARLWQTRPTEASIREISAMIRVLIVDDEQHARNGIRSLLETEQDVEVVGECREGREALESLQVLQPDALFLDIQMPGLTGIEVLKTARLAKRPYTVFTTAHHDFALQAFEVEAVDYLLKPFDAARFRAALLKIRMQVDRDSRADGRLDMAEILSRLPGLPTALAPPPSDRVPVKIGRRVRFLSVAHVRYIAADGNYVNIHMTTGEVIHTSERISVMEEKLRAQHFLRVHRSLIINIDQVREAHSMGSYYGFTMTDGARLTSGLTYKKNIHGLLSAWKKVDDGRVD
jgi:two-component system LytT family response regulator